MNTFFLNFSVLNIQESARVATVEPCHRSIEVFQTKPGSYIVVGSYKAVMGSYKAVIGSHKAVVGS